MDTVRLAKIVARGNPELLGLAWECVNRAVDSYNPAICPDVEAWAVTKGRWLLLDQTSPRWADRAELLGDHDPMSREIDSDTVRDIRLAVSQLPERHRIATELLMEGWLLREIGDKLGVTESAISLMLKHTVFPRLKKRLRSLIN